MNKIAMLVVAAFAGVALTACGSTVQGSTVTVTAEPPSVTAAPEPTTPEPTVEESTEAPPEEDSLMQAVVTATWNNLTEDEKSDICSLYDFAPDTAEESFREGYGEDADEAWPILAKILKKEC